MIRLAFHTAVPRGRSARPASNASSSRARVPEDARACLASALAGISGRRLAGVQLAQLGLAHLLSPSGREQRSEAADEGEGRRGGTHVVVLLALAELVEVAALLLEVLLEARLVLPLDLGGAGPRIVSAPPASATSEADGLHPHAAAHAQRRRWAPVARSPTAARAREVRSPASSVPTCAAFSAFCSSVTAASCVCAARLSALAALCSFCTALSTACCALSAACRGARTGEMSGCERRAGRGRSAHPDALGVGLVGAGEVGDRVIEVLLVRAGLFGDPLLDIAHFGVGGEVVRLAKQRHGVVLRSRRERSSSSANVVGLARIVEDFID